MKKMKYIIIGLCCMFIMAGCGNKIPEMDEQQRAQIVEYSAMLLLKYDKNYQSSIIDEKEVARQEEKLESAAALKIEIEEQKKQEAEKENEPDANNTSSSDTTAVVAPVYTDIDDFFELDGVDIEFSNYIVCDTYPDNLEENTWQGVCRATGSNKLVVFVFDITNNSGMDYYLDMASLDTRFSLKINSNITKSAITTMLLDDLITYRDTIMAGETRQAVIIIEMSPDDAQSISSAVLKMKFNGVLAETTLL